MMNWLEEMVGEIITVCRGDRQYTEELREFASIGFLTRNTQGSETSWTWQSINNLYLATQSDRVLCGWEEDA